MIVCREVLGLQLALTPDQFMKAGSFVKRRRELVVQVARSVQALHREGLVKRKLHSKHTKAYSTCVPCIAPRDPACMHTPALCTGLSCPGARLATTFDLSVPLDKRR